MSRKRQAEFAVCALSTCTIQFRRTRAWKQYCSPKCAKKAKRARDAASGILSGIPVPSYPPSISVAKNSAYQGQNDGQTGKKCLPNEGVVSSYESLLVRGPNGRKWGLSPEKVTAEMLEAEGIQKTPLLSVVRAMCLDCRPPEEVLVCARPYCPLWPYRDGTSPWKRGDGETAAST